MISNDLFLNMLNAPVRMLRGRVEIYEGSTLSLICGCHDSLKEFSVERVGEGKFFGYGICQKVNVKLRDTERAISITTANSLELVFGIGTDYIYPFPRFYVSRVYRDEKTNELSITAYDSLYNATLHTVSELGLTIPYTLGDFAIACGSVLGLPVLLNDNPAFDIYYTESANFDGTETIREALNALAEATQSIYYIDSEWRLVFKQLRNDTTPALEIDKEKYITLDSGNNRRLSTLCHVTELGDNISASTGYTGTTQYLRNNPFYELREDLGSLLEEALATVGGLTINQFTCEWRGNFLLEIGDKISLVTKDNTNIYSYLLNDTLTFDGSLYQSTLWDYEEDEAETENNPSNLGDALKQTYARVDKVNKQIELVVSDVNSNTETISALQLNTDTITASVQKLETVTGEAVEGLNSDIATLNSRVEASITSEDVEIQIRQELANGVDKVTTSTGFTFNEEGLTVSRSGSEMTTTISEDGMKVFRDNTEVLTADNEGVKAEDLHATTYLIVGSNSRFENYGTDRTGCFWIGG